jgi:hypothetical protein
MQRSYLPAIVVMIAMVFTAFVATGSNRSQSGRGAGIVNRVSMCGNCHTPMLPDGEPDAASQLTGSPLFFNPTVRVRNWASRAPNLTPAGVLKGWTDEQVIKFLMTGTTPAGDRANPPMPRYCMDETDAVAVTAYLRSLPSVK